MHRSQKEIRVIGKIGTDLFYRKNVGLGLKIVVTEAIPNKPIQRTSR